MSAFKMRVSDSSETTSVMTTLQMVFGCIFNKCGQHVVEVYAFAVGDEGVIRETLEDVGAVFCGRIALPN